MASSTMPFSLAMNSVTQVAEVCGLGGHILSPRDLRDLITADKERMESVATILQRTAKQSGLLSDADNPEVLACEYARVRDMISKH